MPTDKIGKGAMAKKARTIMEKIDCLREDHGGSINLTLAMDYMKRYLKVECVDKRKR